MEYTIEIRNSQALPFVKGIRKAIMDSLEKKLLSFYAFSQKFAGNLSNETAKTLHDNVQSSRDEWNRAF